MHSNHRLPFNKHTVSSGQISSGAAQSLQVAVLKCRINHLPLPHLYPKLRGLHDRRTEALAPTGPAHQSGAGRARRIDCPPRTRARRADELTGTAKLWNGLIGWTFWFPLFKPFVEVLTQRLLINGAREKFFRRCVVLLIHQLPK